MEQIVECKSGLRDKLASGKDYYEIRLESIGGLGANLCGKMLGELGVKYLDVNSSNFSSYGSEKTGTPVKGFIRYCRKEKDIRVHYPVVEPDVLVIFHQALLKDKSVWKGCNKDTAVIIALEPGQEQADEIGCDAAEVYGLEAQRIAMETHSRINVVMLGAVLKIMGVEDITVGEQICKDTLGKKYPDALKGNLEGLRRGYEEVRQIKVKQSGVKKDINTGINRLSEWGYDNAPIGGINPRFGNTVIADLSPSRQGYIPLFIKEKCINCGLCHSTCPDMVFQFEKGQYKGRDMMVNKGLDYYHCKGCLRCVDVCPVNALVTGIEAEHSHKEYFMPNKELLRMPDYYEESGPDGYITSESYLTEKRMEGGEV
ncbi:MAG: 2-oxoacid:acceptor oxidoreductase family protein [Lachnospiraceae bacterium]|nr:2-oxoacid:acceptor oxidoreductase family protein [Lachnospiraceae bacterium]